MRKISLIIFLVFLLAAACSTTPTPVVVVPTLAILPSATASPTWTPSPLPTWTISPSPVPSDTVTPLPSETGFPSATATPVPSETDTPTETASSTQTDTFTPSLTITNTITPTPTSTFTPSQELDGLGMLALLSERATILPLEVRYNPQTLTAVALAAQTLIAAGTLFAPTSPVAQASTPVIGEPQLATLPPPMDGSSNNSNTTSCATALPGGLSGAFAADPSLTPAIGCPQGQPFSTTTAVQSFEHGTMIYIQGSPGSMYVLTFDGRFRRFDDTWVSGVDPETGGETPPLGLIEPKRGFGKVWRNNLDVRGALGWGVTEESGAQSSLLLFDRGRAVYLPTLGSTYLLIEDPGGASGSWRSVGASF
ncbi:MAG: hypothetical protein ABI700_14050 [Chloroflexota bacterium]